MTRPLIVPLISLTLLVTLGLTPARAQDKHELEVHAFTIVAGVNFPYDMKNLQSQAIAELKTKNGEEFEVVNDDPQDKAHVYILDGEVQEWHKGNVAERMALALGSVAGRENAKIHFWLTDKDGKRVFEQTDTIRQLFMRNVHEKNSGMLVQPFAEKIAERLKDAKLPTTGGDSIAPR